jgi:heavy metal translocating P-type ATPase
LGATLSGLLLGGALRVGGLVSAADSVWLAVGSLGAAYALWTMIDALRHRRFGLDVVALLALLGALLLGESLAAAVIAVMLASGRALESWAAGRARRDLRALLERAPRTARRLENGELVVVPVDALAPGDRALVATGEIVPADGTLRGGAVLDEAALTGESVPVERDRGDAVRSGAINAGAPFEIEVSAPAAESAYARIVQLVAQAESSPAPFVRLADRYALWFVAVTLVVSAVAWALGGATRAVAVLVVATPCPLILAAPIALVAGLSQAARRGVVMKGGSVLERLATCTTMLIDKTGTLTAGHPALAAIVSAGDVSGEQLLALAGALDQVSSHVLARAIVRAARQRAGTLEMPVDVVETPGKGIRGRVGGRVVAIGNAEWTGMRASPPWAKAARRRARLEGAVIVFVTLDGAPAGALLLEDPIRPDAASTIRALHAGGMTRIVMVTGDRREVAEALGAVIGVDEVVAERSPAEKLDVVASERDRAPTLMVGDGINDAPALALAHVGVAMGATGATAASEAADIVLTADRLDLLATARAVALRARRIALESVGVGMALSLAAMGVAAAGLLPAVWGALLQEGIDVLVILNALRALAAPRANVQLGESESSLARRFRDEHVTIRAVIDQLREVADQLSPLEAERSLAQVRDIHRVLALEVAPHELAEQQELYPLLDRVLGGHDATGTMARAHAEIAHQIRLLGQLLDDIGAGPPDGEDIVDLRRLLYGLHAVLRLHTQQEDESYLSLAAEAAPLTSPG